MYYFNSATSRWQYPTASFASGQFDIANPFGDAVAERLIEVDRGFNAFGFNLASGSSNRSLGTKSTDANIGKNWTKNNEIQSLIKKYDKSVQIDQRYSANNDESFSVPIQQPFLLEKAVIELPLEAGPGWFNDKTKCFIPLTYTSPGSPDEVDIPTFDVGGPGLTVALYNQISIGPNKKKRDLVLSGTITHEFDDVAEISFKNSPDVPAGDGSGFNDIISGEIWQVFPQGFRAYSTPTAVIKGISSGSGYYFTGSTTLKCTAEISNGVLIRDSFYLGQAYNGSGGYMDEALNSLFSSSVWTTPGYNGYESFFNDGTYGFRNRTICSINNFGRGCSGFEPSGRSILGKEYVTAQGKTDSYDNPFYLYQDVNTLASIKSKINSPSYDADNIVYASSLVSKQQSVTSPYLLLPGDRLVLSVSKTRPVFFSTLTSDPYTSGSIQHDIKLTTGSINITLYGSLIANGQEFHDTLNQPLASDAIHEVVIGETKTW